MCSQIFEEIFDFFIVSNFPNIFNFVVYFLFFNQMRGGKGDTQTAY